MNTPDSGDHEPGPHERGHRDPEQVWVAIALVVVVAGMLGACALIAFLEISGRA